ncbi:hypothetical protein [Thalassotalea hakodatensis]|uniref:hypothetical protein n=1 Tax=Thalassotalea hakodatensis TaxID=3030492 RepID=UPI00257363B1|nr:hypothetical protein [Thalassotalea hakodatensis]
MTQQEQANSREKSLSENIIIITLVACLMSVFIYYFFKQEQRFTKVSFETAASTFSTRVMSIRAQWFMENQPSVVTIKKEDMTISVNGKGWVDFQQVNNNCGKIWQVVMQSPLTFMNQPVAAIERFREKPTLQRSCRYQLASGEYFDYALQTGTVSQVMVIK